MAFHYTIHTYVYVSGWLISKRFICTIVNRKRQFKKKFNKMCRIVEKFAKIRNVIKNTGQFVGYLVDSGDKARRND